MADPASGVITLLTDFGNRDPYVGVMKGAILARFRGATVVDLTHEIAPQDVAEAGFWMERARHWFPPGTVHVGVVDPGVGTQRLAIAARVDGHYFVGPDNGLFGPTLERTPGGEVRALDLTRLAPAPISNTFHGRDVFAPTAAELASGQWSFEELGPATSFIPAPRNGPESTESGWCGSVATVDHFGNLITDLGAELTAGLSRPVLRVAGLELPILETFGQAAIGQPFAYIGSFATWEIAVRNGSAARDLGLGRGARVELRGGDPDQTQVS